MKEKFLQLENKTKFLDMLSSKLNIKQKSLTRYIYSGNTPEKHKQRIETAIDLQLKADFKKFEIQVMEVDNFV